MIPQKIKNQIQVVHGDITKLDCDCIVNAAIGVCWVAAVWTVLSTEQQGRNCWLSAARCTAAAPEKQKSLRATG